MPAIRDNCQISYYGYHSGDFLGAAPMRARVSSAAIRLTGSLVMAAMSFYYMGSIWERNGREDRVKPESGFADRAESFPLNAWKYC